MKRNVLFVGNSFTYFNRLPYLFWEMTLAAGHTCRVDMLTYGGYHLKQYFDPADKHGRELDYKLRQDKWDYVVFQEQSATPALNGEEFFHSSRVLADKAKAVGAVPVFYQTWSYRDGTEKLASTDMDYDTFYRALKESYETAAIQNQGILIPVGNAFRQISKDENGPDLLLEDDFHPSPEGTFLAACMFYLRLIEKGTAPSYIPEELSPETADFLYQTALRHTI